MLRTFIAVMLVLPLLMLADPWTASAGDAKAKAPQAKKAPSAAQARQYRVVRVAAPNRVAGSVCESGTHQTEVKKETKTETVEQEKPKKEESPKKDIKNKAAKKPTSKARNVQRRSVDPPAF